MIAFNNGFHPKFKIEQYAEMFSRIHARYPELTFYSMTVAEFIFCCKLSRLSYKEGLTLLKSSGVQWITGGGAEVLAESFRKRHSPGKYTVAEYYKAQQAILESGVGSTATMVIGFDETLDERWEHLEGLRAFQAKMPFLPSFLCWTYKPYHTALGGKEISDQEYGKWLAICRIYLDNIPHIRTSVLTKNAGALMGLLYGADDFDLPSEDQVTQAAGATIDLEFERILDGTRALGLEPKLRGAFICREPLPR
jgi:cyclic dehypoxanthinyl futalosine synthase